jgi:ABC-type antimicrobial peptide transport system permease subunit
VDPARLAGRFTMLDGSWAALGDDHGPRVIPAIADKPTAVWGLGMKVGDDLEYTDQRGRTIRVRLVGLIADSILQGSLIVDEAKLLAHYPGADGYRVFGVQTDRPDAVAAHLSRTYADRGLEVTGAAHRLARFMSVQNTYLSIFTALGALGLVIGSIGLGVIVLRNVLERRGELAALRALGYRRGLLGRMIAVEHGWLVLLGLGGGSISAIVAVLPALGGAPRVGPLFTLGLALAAVAISALGWIILSAALALRGAIIHMLDRE